MGVSRNYLRKLNNLVELIINLTYDLGMTRFTTTITTLTASFLFASAADAEDSNLKDLNSRIIELEMRVATLEDTLRGGSSSHSYRSTDEATLEATRGSESRSSDAEPLTYVIQDGDTLGKIAKKHGVERTDLLEANRLSEGQPIYIGETLLIPGQTAPRKQAEIAGATTKPEKANEKSVVLGPTERRSGPGNSGSYTVVRGDTLHSIARRHETDVASLKAANGLRSDVISPGQRLTIPSGGTQTVSADRSQSPQYQYDNPLLRNDETYGYYTVRKGDNLYALARDFFTSMAELQRLNRLGDSTLIYPGNELIVPTKKYNGYHNNGNVAQR